MSETIPTIGRMVNYVLTDGDATAINQRRADAYDSVEMHRKFRTGAIVHVGNAAREGDVFPMLITRVWDKTPDSPVNGQVFLDGNDAVWVTSVHVGQPGVSRTFTY